MIHPSGTHQPPPLVWPHAMMGTSGTRRLTLWECHYSVLRPHKHPGLSAASTELVRLLVDSANLTLPSLLKSPPASPKAKGLGPMNRFAQSLEVVLRSLEP